MAPTAASITTKSDNGRTYALTARQKYLVKPKGKNSIHAWRYVKRIPTDALTVLRKNLPQPRGQCAGRRRSACPAHCKWSRSKSGKCRCGKTGAKCLKKPARKKKRTSVKKTAKRKKSVKKTPKKSKTPKKPASSSTVVPMGYKEWDKVLDNIPKESVGRALPDLTLAIQLQLESTKQTRLVHWTYRDGFDKAILEHKLTERLDALWDMLVQQLQDFPQF